MKAPLVGKKSSNAHDMGIEPFRGTVRPGIGQKQVHGMLTIDI